MSYDQLISSLLHTIDAREFCQIVHNNFTRVYIIINEGYSLMWSIPSQSRHSCQAESCGSNDFGCPIGTELWFFLRWAWVKSGYSTQEELACCIFTNSASIATTVPGVGNSSGRRGSCFIRVSSLCLIHFEKRQRVIRGRNKQSNWSILVKNWRVEAGGNLAQVNSRLHVGSFEVDDSRHLTKNPHLHDSVLCPIRQAATYLPTVWEAQSFIFGDIIYDEIIEEKPRAYRICPSFSLGDYNQY